MASPEPEVVIVVEGGVVTAVATRGPGFPYRIMFKNIRRKRM